MATPFSLFIGHLICVYSLISYEGTTASKQHKPWMMASKWPHCRYCRECSLECSYGCTYVLFVFIQSIQTTFFRTDLPLPVIQRYSGPPYIFTDILYAVSGLVSGVVRKLFFSKECAFFVCQFFQNKLIKTQYIVNGLNVNLIIFP